MMFTPVISKQKRLRWCPKIQLMTGMFASHSRIMSGADRSEAQRNDSPRSSMHDGRNENIAT